MRSAVCARLVVAPPISSGKVIPARSISAATVTISSSDGVMRPDRPIIAASCSRAVSRILVQGTITPRSMTSKPLHWRTTPTMFLPNVVDVALDGGHDHPAFRRVDAGSLFGFDEGQQMGDRLLHYARRLDDLRQEHLARTEQVADQVHALHQRAFNDLDRACIGQARFLGIGDDVGIDSP
jgi:hypothetical protein